MADLLQQEKSKRHVCVLPQLSVHLPCTWEGRHVKEKQQLCVLFVQSSIWGITETCLFPEVVLGNLGGQQGAESHIFKMQNPFC